MNAWQLLKQLRHKLKAAEWPDTGSKYFPPESVLITTAPLDQVLGKARPPICLIRTLGGEPDPEHGQEYSLFERRVEVVLAAVVPGDRTGEKSLIGGNWLEAKSSPNAGLLELEEGLYSTQASLGEDDGVKIKLHGASASLGEQVSEDSKHISFAGYEFAAKLGVGREYPGVRNLAATALTASGQVSLSWVNPSSRFDLKRIMVRYLSGTVAPTATTGTEVTLANKLDTSVTVTGLTASTLYQFGVFAVYDDRNQTPTEDQEFSAAKTASATTN